MNTIDLIRENLKRSEAIVLSKIEDMRDHCMVRPIEECGCHTLWLLGHLAFIESLVIHTFMLGDPNPLDDWEEMFDGNEVSDDVNSYISFDEAILQCRASRSETIALLNSQTETDLDKSSKSCPNNVEHLFGTYRHCFQYVSDHWFMHRGQLANCRLAAGIDQMWY